MKNRGTTMGWTIVAMIIFGMMSNTLAEDTERAVFMSNLPYTRGLENDVKVARIILIPQRMYHPKRNAELINSILGLPMTMINSGRK